MSGYLQRRPKRNRMQPRVEVKMLAMLGAVLLAAGASEGLDECQLRKDLDTLLPANVLKHINEDLAKIICSLGRLTSFNTSKVTNITEKQEELEDLIEVFPTSAKPSVASTTAKPTTISQGTIISQSTSSQGNAPSSFAPTGNNPLPTTTPNVRKVRSARSHGNEVPAGHNATKVTATPHNAHSSASSTHPQNNHPANGSGIKGRLVRSIHKFLIGAKWSTREVSSEESKPASHEGSDEKSKGKYKDEESPDKPEDKSSEEHNDKPSDESSEEHKKPEDESSEEHDDKSSEEHKKLEDESSEENDDKSSDGPSEEHKKPEDESSEEHDDKSSEEHKKLEDESSEEHDDKSSDESSEENDDEHDVKPSKDGTFNPPPSPPNAIHFFPPNSLPQGNGSFPSGGPGHRQARSTHKDAEETWTLYGVFQLPGEVACTSGSGSSLNLCNMSCNNLLNQDITDDIACLGTIISKSFSGKHPEDFIKKLYKILLKNECDNETNYFHGC